MSEFQTLLDTAKDVLSVIASLGVIVGAIFAFVRWILKQNHQSEEIEANDKHIEEVEQECKKRIVEIEKECEKKIDSLKTETDEMFHSIQFEQTVICYGVLAALKGLQEQGCNGPVTKAIDKLEKHLNVQAHK